MLKHKALHRPDFEHMLVCWVMKISFYFGLSKKGGVGVSKNIHLVHLCFASHNPAQKGIACSKWQTKCEISLLMTRNTVRAFALVKMKLTISTIFWPFLIVWPVPFKVTSSFLAKYFHIFSHTFQTLKKSFFYDKLWQRNETPKHWGFYKGWSQRRVKNPVQHLQCIFLWK